MKRFFEPQALEANSEISLSARNFHYLKHVLRMNEGTEVLLFDGNGNEFACKISSIGKKDIKVAINHIIDSPNNESLLNTHLGIVLSKGDRFDFALQKATELGVSQITPLTSMHCDVKLNASRMDKKLQHWQDTVISACEQSGRTIPPVLHPVSELNNWAKEIVADCKWLFHTKADDDSQIDTKQNPNSLAILIGPEGGLHQDEVNSGLEAGFELIQLGGRILRTETAPIVALTIAQLRYGDFLL